jgi:transglutaminase-like putative cysteine protease
VDNWNNWKKKTAWEKWVFLRDVPAKDAERPEVQALAANLWAVACASKYPRWAYVELAQCVARDLIRYVTDTSRVGREQIDGFTDPYISPLAPLERGTDDCDAKARLFVALCLAKQIAAEMVPRPGIADLKAGRPLTHVSAKVFIALPAYNRETKELTEDAPRWVPVETILARAKVAEQAEHVPHEKDTGNWLYS